MNTTSDDLTPAIRANTQYKPFLIFLAALGIFAALLFLTLLTCSLWSCRQRRKAAALKSVRDNAMAELFGQLRDAGMLRGVDVIVVEKRRGKKKDEDKDKDKDKDKDTNTDKDKEEEKGEMGGEFEDVDLEEGKEGPKEKRVTRWSIVQYFSSRLR